MGWTICDQLQYTVQKDLRSLYFLKLPSSVPEILSPVPGIMPYLQHLQHALSNIFPATFPPQLPVSLSQDACLTRSDSMRDRRDTARLAAATRAGILREAFPRQRRRDPKHNTSVPGNR